MPNGTLDAVLTWLVPTILILIVVWFIWTKMLGAWLGPHLHNFWNWMTGQSARYEKNNRIIVYE